MAAPVVTVDVAFGSNPGAASYTWTKVHEDRILPRIRELQYKRGRQNELGRMEAGTGTLTLKDPDSDFDPDNTASLYSPNVRPMAPIRAQATLAGTTYPLFQHFVERWPRTTRVRDIYTERAVTTVDGFEWFARASMYGSGKGAYPGQLTGARVNTVLDDIGWSSALRDIDAGQDTIAAVTFANGDDTKALTHLLDVMETENGLLFCDAQGRVAFVQRHALITSPYTVSQVTFRDAKAGGAGYPYVESQPSYDLDATVNKWAGTRTGGTTQTVEDSSSQTKYGVRSKEITSLVTTDLIVADQIAYKLALFKEPLNRLETVTVMPANDTGFWQAVLGLEIGERVTIRELPPGFTTAKSRDYVIQSIEARFPTGPTSAARFTFGLWPADQTAWLILDDAVYGKLDTGALAY